MNLGAAASSTLFDLSGGTNYASGAGRLSSASIYGGTGADTLTLTGDITGGKIGGGAGNDSISFGGELTSAGVSVIGGAGNDTLNFGVYATGASIAGGLGNDSILFGKGFSSTNGGNTYFWWYRHTPFGTQRTQTAAGSAIISTLLLVPTFCCNLCGRNHWYNVVANRTTTLAFVSGVGNGIAVALGTYTSHIQ